MRNRSREGQTELRKGGSIMPIRRNSRSLSLEKRPSDSSRNLLVERLQELRWRLLKSIGAILMSAVIAFFFRTRIVTFLSIPFPEQASTFHQQVARRIR